MRPELSIFSFLCAVLLVGLAPLHVQARNVAMLTLVAWLLVCNIIQGANSIVWSDNTVVRSRVWCDISTKVLLGAHIAIPAACTCIAMHLYLLASNRDAKQRRYRIPFELTLCVILPLVYMAFHTIVQDRRFDVAENFGCVSSVYTSIAAIILVWSPPLILCIIAFVFAALASWSHTHRNPFASSELSPRIITITFLRPLFMTTVICTLLFSVSIFDIYVHVVSNNGILPWVSWMRVHANLSRVYVVPPSAQLELSRIEVSWWIIPASSLVFTAMAIVGLICCVQHDSYNSHSLGKWFRSTILRRPGTGETFIQSSRGLTSHIALNSPSPLFPVHLKSGWEDSLGSARGAKVQIKRPALTCEIPCSPSTPTSDSDSDASFKASTLTYLESPTGKQAVGLASLPSIGSSLPSLPTPVISASALPTTSPPTTSISPANSILSSPWPQPPSTIPSTPTKPKSPAHLRSVQHLRSPSETSLTTSLASSTLSTSAYLPDPDIFLHSVATSSHRPPFQDAGIPAPVLNTRDSKRVRRVPSSKELIVPRALSSSGRRTAGRRREDAEAIYMTVVHETQAY